MAVEVDWLGGNCPVQAEGTFDGTPFYFRARGTRATVDVGDWTWWGPEYEWPDAGWVSEEVARAYINTAYERWLCRDHPARKPDGYWRRHNGLRDSQTEYWQWAHLLDKELGDVAKPVCDWLRAQADEVGERLAEDNTED